MLSLEGLFAPSALSGSCLRDLQGLASHSPTCYLPLWMPQALYYQGPVNSRYLNLFAKVAVSLLKSLSTLDGEWSHAVIVLEFQKYP